MFWKTFPKQHYAKRILETQPRREKHESEISLCQASKHPRKGWCLPELRDVPECSKASRSSNAAAWAWEETVVAEMPVQQTSPPECYRSAWLRSSCSEAQGLAFQLTLTQNRAKMLSLLRNPKRATSWPAGDQRNIVRSPKSRQQPQLERKRGPNMG